MKLDSLIVVYNSDEIRINNIRAGFADIIICWFGVIATKYANITNIPATYTKNTITANHVDDVIANVVATIIDIANSLSAAIIGFGASNIDEDKRMIVDRIVEMIIYKFWGWTKSINFKG